MWAVLRALLSFRALWWAAKQARDSFVFKALWWTAKQVRDSFVRWRKEQAEIERRELHLQHRNEQLERAHQNRKARREAWIAAATPERREKYEKIRAVCEE